MFPNPEKLGIKVCGITQAHQAREIIDAGADAIGVNFWPKSKRYLPPDVGAQWLPALKSDITIVAVLVNPDTELLRQITDTGLVHALQFHGDESPEEIATWMDSGFQVIKALQIRDASSLDQISTYPCADILLDAYNPGLYGGEGKVFPWDLARQAKERFPAKRVWLSGGSRQRTSAPLSTRSSQRPLMSPAVWRQAPASRTWKKCAVSSPRHAAPPFEAFLQSPPQLARLHPVLNQSTKSCSSRSIRLGMPHQYQWDGA